MAVFALNHQFYLSVNGSVCTKSLNLFI